MTDELDTWNQRFGLTHALRFTPGPGGLPLVDVDTPLAQARIALQGAQVLAWQPAGQQPVLWVSRAAVFEPGKAVRGGVPVCWPWFGARDGLPAHGFVRTRLWAVRQTRVNASGEVVLRLGVGDDAASHALWDFAFDLELVVTVGSTLSLALTTRNTGLVAFNISQALHSYFSVSNIGQTQVLGLDGTSYLDKLQNFAPCQQTGAVSFSAETDRVYLGTTASCVIDDTAGHRRIQVAKAGSTSTVVWNPGSEREKAFADMAAGEHKGMVCVETCNAGPDEITLAPGASHILTAIISIAA